jgi:spore germination protein KA
LKQNRIYPKRIKIKSKNKNQEPFEEKKISDTTQKAQEKCIFSTVEENLYYIDNLFGKGIGLIDNSYEALGGRVKIGIAYIESMIDKELISRNVLMPLLQYDADLDGNVDDILNLIQSRLISATDIYNAYTIDQAVVSILNGDTALFVEGIDIGIIIGSRKVEKRSVEKPENESTVLASQESFTDDLSSNISLVIKRLPTPKLNFETFMVGRLSRSIVKLIWLEGIANPKIIQEARNRIQKIDIDNVDGIGTLAELIDDKPLSPFPKYRQTERPDVLARNLSDGRFGILCSDSPFAFIAPGLLWDNFKTMDDYAETSLSGTYLRAVRYIAALISVFISSLYLSFVTYNHIIVPPVLASDIAAGREGVPFPSVIELMLMTFAMSVVREAGLRMPGMVGYFIGTLAAVLIGQSIVTAGYVSASLIIVIAISTISSLAISTTTVIYASRLLNYFLILLSSIFGMFGLINGAVLILWHLVSLQSFGVPYLYPVVPYDKEGLKDIFIRVRFSALKKRLRILSPFNRTRAGEDAKQDKKRKRNKNGKYRETH